MTCPCEACKATRARRRGNRSKSTRVAIARAESLMGIYKGRLRRFEDALKRIESARGAVWIQGDGTPIQLQAMGTAHLHYAIAKCYRGEAGSRSPARLEAEALRRLIGGTWPENEAVYA